MNHGRDRGIVSQGYEIFDNSSHHLACSSRSDHHLCDSVWMKNTCCLQVMVSEYPRGEPLLQANDE
jgi:hypothetical protein